MAPGRPSETKQRDQAEARRIALHNIRLTTAAVSQVDFAFKEAGGAFHITFNDAFGHPPDWGYAPSFHLDTKRNAWKSRVGRTTFLTNVCPVFELVVELRGYLLLGDITRDAVCLDLGPFLGISGMYLAKRANRGRVVFVEPDARSAARLLDNIRLNALTNTEVAAKAVHSETGRAAFVYENSDESRLAAPGESRDAAGMVDTISLPDLVAERRLDRLDLVKIDVEGAEFELADGLEWLLETFPQAVVAMASYHERDGRTSAAMYEKRFAGHPFVRLKTAYPNHLTTYMVHGDNTAAVAALDALTPCAPTPKS